MTHPTHAKPKELQRALKRLICTCLLGMTSAFATTPFRGKADLPPPEPAASEPRPEAIGTLLSQLREVCVRGLIFEPVMLADYLPFSLSSDDGLLVQRQDKAPPPLGMYAFYARNFWQATPTLTMRWQSVAPLRIVARDFRDAFGKPDNIDEVQSRIAGGRVEIYESFCKANSQLLVTYSGGSNFVNAIEIVSR